MLTPISVIPLNGSSSSPSASGSTSGSSSPSAGDGGSSPAAPASPVARALPARAAPVQAAAAPGSMEQRILAAFTSMAQGIAAGAHGPHGAALPAGSPASEGWADQRLAATISSYFQV